MSGIIYQCPKCKKEYENEIELIEHRREKSH